MREIIYIQAGRVANHVGAHFWNAQQNYFTYGEDAEEPIVDHDISFREGVNLQVSGSIKRRIHSEDRNSDLLIGRTNFLP